MSKNKLIIEFLGYKLIPCNNGKAWSRPTLSSIHDDFNIHGRLWRENDLYYKFNSSWDWLMPVIKKIDIVAIDMMSINEYDDYQNIKWRMIDKPSKYPIEKVFNQVSEFIEMYNKKKPHEKNS